MLLNKKPVPSNIRNDHGIVEPEAFDLTYLYGKMVRSVLYLHFAHVVIIFPYVTGALYFQKTSLYLSWVQR